MIRAVDYRDKFASAFALARKSSSGQLLKGERQVRRSVTSRLANRRSCGGFTTTVAAHPSATAEIH